MNPKPKPKRGRPSNPRGTGSADWLRLRIPTDELRAIKRAAKAARSTLTAYVRQTLRASAPPRETHGT